MDNSEVSTSHTLPHQQLLWLSSGQEITTFKPVISQTRTNPHFLVLVFHRHLWGTLQLGKPLVHYCSAPLPWVSPPLQRGCRDPRPPSRAKHTNAVPTAGAGWKLLPLASCLRFPPSTATPTCLTQPIKAGIYSRQLGASTISHARQEPLVRGVTGWKWWRLSPRCPHACECRELGLVWLLWKMQNKLL